MSEWLGKTSAEWSVWVDDDMWLSWDGLIAFCESALDHEDADFLAGVYVPKAKASRVFTALFRDPDVTLGHGGEIVPLLGCGFGLVAVKRSLALRVAERLPRVRYTNSNVIGWPFFASLIVPAPEDTEAPHRHAGEDFSFCSRALAVGAKLYADTRIRLGHEGTYIYNWEDAAEAVTMVETIHTHRNPVPFTLDGASAPDGPRLSRAQRRRIARESRKT